MHPLHFIEKVKLDKITGVLGHTWDRENASNNFCKRHLLLFGVHNGLVHKLIQGSAVIINGWNFFFRLGCTRLSTPDLTGQSWVLADVDQIRDGLQIEFALMSG